MKNKFTINYELPTLNDYTKSNRANKYKGNSVKKKATDICSFLALQQHLSLDNCIYDVSIVWYQKNQRKDPDNIYFGVKFILDGIVSAGILPNDGQKNIRDISHKIRRDKNSNYNYCVVEFIKVQS